MFIKCNAQRPKCSRALNFIKTIFTIIKHVLSNLCHCVARYSLLSFIVSTISVHNIIIKNDLLLSSNLACGFQWRIQDLNEGGACACALMHSKNNYHYAALLEGTCSRGVRHLLAERGGAHVPAPPPGSATGFSKN